MAVESTKEISVVILGGCGFVGRNLVKYLYETEFQDVKISKIVVADKLMPKLAYMRDECAKLFSDKERVTFKHSDLSQDAHVNRLFKDQNFTYVFNCCGETRAGKAVEDYELRNVRTAEKASAVAKKAGVEKWIEVSTARIYKQGKPASTENDKLDPWTNNAKARLKAEGVIKKCGIPYVILRPAIIYGPGDREGLMPRFVCAATYKSNEKMNFLWNKGTRINCVHVEDVVRAMWLCATKAESGSIFNLCDESDFDQLALKTIIEQIFHIKTGFFNKLISKAAGLNLSYAAEHANSTHMPNWTDLTLAHNILNTPLSPYIDAEALKKAHLSVDGKAICKSLGFKYEYPKINKKLCQGILDGYVKQGIFPPIFDQIVG